MACGAVQVVGSGVGGDRDVILDFTDDLEDLPTNRRPADGEQDQVSHFADADQVRGPPGGEHSSRDRQVFRAEQGLNCSRISSGSLSIVRRAASRSFRPRSQASTSERPTTKGRGDCARQSVPSRTRIG